MNKITILALGLLLAGPYALATDVSQNKAAPAQTQIQQAPVSKTVTAPEQQKVEQPLPKQETTVQAAPVEQPKATVEAAPVVKQETIQSAPVEQKMEQQQPVVEAAPIEKQTTIQTAPVEQKVEQQQPVVEAAPIEKQTEVQSAPVEQKQVENVDQTKQTGQEMDVASADMSPIVSMGSSKVDPGRFLDQGYDYAIANAQSCMTYGRFLKHHSACYVVYNDGRRAWVTPQNRDEIRLFILKLNRQRLAVGQ